MNQQREYRLTSILHPKRWFLILLNCAKLKFVSCTSNLLEQMCGFQKRTMFLQKWILNLQDLPRNQSLETVPVCIVSQCHPHNNIICIDMCDECRRSNDSVVCHRLWSISWSIVQVCSLFMEYQAFYYVPSSRIPKQLKSIRLTILLQISIPPLWSDGHRCME